MRHPISNRTPSCSPSETPVPDHAAVLGQAQDVLDTKAADALKSAEPVVEAGEPLRCRLPRHPDDGDGTRDEMQDRTTRPASCHARRAPSTSNDVTRPRTSACAAPSPSRYSRSSSAIAPSKSSSSYMMVSACRPASSVRVTVSTDAIASCAGMCSVVRKTASERPRVAITLLSSHPPPSKIMRAPASDCSWFSGIETTERRSSCFQTSA